MIQHERSSIMASLKLGLRAVMLLFAAYFAKGAQYKDGEKVGRINKNSTNAVFSIERERIFHFRFQFTSTKSALISIHKKHITITRCQFAARSRLVR